MQSRLGLAFGALFGAALLVPAPFVAPPAAAQEMMQLTQAGLIHRLIPSVVNITAKAEVPAQPETDQASASSNPTTEIRFNAGSGFIIDPSGLIATNWHVVANAFEILVTFSDGTRVTATVFKAARSIDLAVLKVDVGHKLPAVTWGDSSKVQIGDPVLAIGNPLGVGISVSAGIVSALNRNISDTPYDDFIQTDAAINHGNSGGPLFNMQGQVIGVNSAIISTTSSNAGLGFSLPSNDAKFVFDRLIHGGEYGRPAWLGVKIQAVTPEMAEAMGEKDPQGSIVAAVLPGGPAEKAGLEPGDVILRFDHDTPTDDRALLRAIIRQKPGEQATLGVLRGDKPMTFTVKLGSWPQMMWEKNAAPRQSAAPMSVPHDLGLTGAELTPALRAHDEIKPEVDGVLLTGVMQGTDASRRGLAPGDVVLEVGRTAVRTPQQVQQEIDRARGEGRSFAMFLILPKKPPRSNAQAAGAKWVALQVAAS